MQLHSFGNWLKHRRKALDLTQAELASQVGCSAAAIRKLEAEERRPSVQIAERLAEIFNIAQSEHKSFIRFARGEVRSAPAETKADFPWHTDSKPVRSNLPATVTSLVGRQQEIALVCEYLLDPEIRLVTLIGPPGIGKTRLSVEAARTVLADFSDGVFFVALAPLADPSLLVFTIAQALGFVETKRQPAIEQLVDGIGEKRMLIVLDNCEHLIEGIASLVWSLLSASPQLTILATSRESLRIPGEWLYTVPVLDFPNKISSMEMEPASHLPALSLFAERARAVRSDFTLTPENIQAIASICAHVDGLPLAIELMAARMRSMSPQTLLERLNKQFVLSANGMRSISTRQKTLNDAIAWSYNLLSEEEQRLFAYLSVFSGSFTLEAVEMTFSEMLVSTSITNLMTSLLDKSLLQRAFDSESRSEIRFNMLVTIRHFALNCLQSMGQEAEARSKHLAYFLDLAEKADKELRGPNQVEWFGRLGTERDNLRAALDWAIETGQTEIALQMACHLSFFWFRRSDLSEGRQWLGRVVTLPEAGRYPKLYSYALAQLAFHAWLHIGSSEARPFVQQALSVALAHDDKWNTAWALTVLGLVLNHERDFMTAQSTLEESRPIFREIEDRWGHANAVISLALVAFHQNDRVTSLALHEEALTEFRQLADKYFENVALRFIGMMEVSQGNLQRGVTALREALIIAGQLHSKYEIYAAMWAFAEAAQRAENYTRAVRLYTAAINVAESIGVWRPEDQTEFENNVVTCRAALEESEFAAAVEEGRAMTMEQAVEYALEDPGS